MKDVTSELESRVLFIPPTSRDGDITRSLLERERIPCLACSDLGHMTREIAAGAGALLLTGEILTGRGIDDLVSSLERQPTWSDLPVVFLMPGGGQSAAAADALRAMGNITLLDRPASVRALVSALLAALRGRERQYQTREDIVALRRAEARSRELQEQLEVAVNASELGTFHCEMPLGKIYWNDRCKAHFWLPPHAEVDFDLFYSMIHPDDRQKSRKAVEACVYGREVYDIEYRTVSARGEVRWVRATGQTYCNENDEPIRFDGTTQDITQRKRAEEEREQLLISERAARSDAERAGRMKDEFLATLSHELRTPLNAILGWSQLIRGDSQDKATLEEGISVIERNARIQVQLIEDLLDMSRIISGKIRLDMRAIDPAAFVEAAIETVTPAAEAKGIVIQRSVPRQIAEVFGDESRLQQVVWNLLSNAIKFTPRGGRVQVALQSFDSLVKISVTDSGQGIAPDFLSHDFERFRQADASTTRLHGGLGLGLAIVKHLVELHRGTIEAISPGLGRGSTFTVFLPLSGVHHAHGENPGNGEADHAHCAAPVTLDGVSVLVVDDEPDARNLIQRVLEESRARVTTAGSAREALNLLQRETPDVILSDIGMPEMDGYEFLRQARLLNKPDDKRIVAIALTAFARPEDHARALNAGYSLHLSKPVEPRGLVTAVASVAGRAVVNSSRD